MKNYFIIVKTIFVVLFLCLFVIGCTEQEPDMDMFDDYYTFTECSIYGKFDILYIGGNGDNVDNGKYQGYYYFDEDTQTLYINRITMPPDFLYSLKTKEKDKQYYLFGESKVNISDNKTYNSDIRVYRDFVDRTVGYGTPVRAKMVNCDARGKAKIEIYCYDGLEYKKNAEITLKPGQQYSSTLEDELNFVIKYNFIKKENIILVIKP